MVQYSSGYSGRNRARKAGQAGVVLATHHPVGIPMQKSHPCRAAAYEQLQSILSEVPQWSGEEDLRHNMENIGGRLWFCHFWIDHNSMVQLTEDRNGRFHAAYVLDTDTSPEVRRDAALLAQKEFADRMQEWGISLLNAPVPEQMKYASLAEAASHLMQVLNDPESITG